MFCPATKETSFVQAISAAGVMYTLTRNCSLGNLDNCGCDVSKNGRIGEEISSKPSFSTCSTKVLHNYFSKKKKRKGMLINQHHVIIYYYLLQNVKKLI